MFDFNELRLVNPAFLVESTRSYQLPYPIFGFYFVMYMTLFNIVTKVLLGVISLFFCHGVLEKDSKLISNLFYINLTLIYVILWRKITNKIIIKKIY